MAEGTLVITLSNQTAPPPIVSPPLFTGTFITGWHVPTITEWTDLQSALGGMAVAGGYMKKAGLSNWLPPNTGADNSSGFTALGTGSRGASGVFSGINQFAAFWSDTVFNVNASYVGYLVDHAATFTTNGIYLKKYGSNIRLMADFTALSDGETSTVTDYDGNVYPTICIAGCEYMAANLATTHYDDGTPIPIVTDDAAWVALTTAGMCYYNNTS